MTAPPATVPQPVLTDWLGHHRENRAGRIPIHWLTVILHQGFAPATSAAIVRAHWSRAVASSPAISDSVLDVSTSRSPAITAETAADARFRCSSAQPKRSLVLGLQRFKPGDSGVAVRC